MSNQTLSHLLVLGSLGLFVLPCGTAQILLDDGPAVTPMPLRIEACEDTETKVLALPARQDNASALYQLAVCLAGRSAWEKAQGTLDVLFQSFPQFPPALFLQAHISFQTARYSDSIRYITQYLEQDSRNGDARKILGLSYFMTEQARVGETQLLLATEINPSDAQAWYFLGRIPFTRQNFVEALPAFQRALTLDPNNAKYHNHLGQALEGLGRFEVARNAYLKAIELQARLSAGAEWPFYNLGLLSLKEGRAAEAVRFFEQAEARAPAWAGPKVQLVIAYLNLDRTEKAQSYAQQALQIAPEDPKAHYQMARVLKRLGQWQKASEHLLRFEKLQGALNEAADDW